MPTSTMNGTDPIQDKKAEKPPAKLVLCFDGTGNEYLGNTGDTNIVKLYQKLDGNARDQYHYYQPGIGTYCAGEASLNAGLWGRFKRHVSQVIDQGFATTFDTHVIAGYRFVMRYYEPGDKIYLFGFSRGAFTARFLARMISTIGLLSKGNEEMVPFAYKSYQDYENGRSNPEFKEPKKERQAWMKKFSETFCRPNVKVHFLGLFDTVNSVGVFNNPFATPTYLPNVHETACYIRHAVAIDERRCMFRAALLQQQNPDLFEEDTGLLQQDPAKQKQHRCCEGTKDDVKEVYFPGNHGDVGGGWRHKDQKGLADCNEADDPVQLSDNALKWMIQELQAIDHRAEALVFNDHLKTFMNNINHKEEEASTADLHDTLKFGGGLSATTVIFWNILERLPLKRLEMDEKTRTWKPNSWPNWGGTRDIPDKAVLHESVKLRMNMKPVNGKVYLPKNLGLEYLQGPRREGDRPKSFWQRIFGFFRRT